MARIEDREKARVLRKKGKSYSEIKTILGVGKGTLSVWLNDLPLSVANLRRLRDVNPKRIENFRETMRKKREEKFALAYEKAKSDIGDISDRDLFIAGLYLYWGEGTKSAIGKVAIANTDPIVIRAFLQWLAYMHIPTAQLRVKLHLYKDMNKEKETRYWSNELHIPITQFRKPHIKNSMLTGITYKNGYGHGTCNLSFDNMRLWEYITMALKRIREVHGNTRP